ncbi:MAG: hypothetical protein ACR5K7_02970 [Symbiopectobacterium sp.]
MQHIVSYKTELEEQIFRQIPLDIEQFANFNFLQLLGLPQPGNCLLTVGIGAMASLLQAD